jgi:phage terminase small subunit
MAHNGQLTARQAKFVAEYLIGGNGSDAARKAGYSPKASHVQASQLLANPKIQAAIREGQRKAQDEADITAAEITKELVKIGLAEIGDPVKLPHKLKALELLIRQVNLAGLEERLAAIEDMLAQQRRGLRAV